MFIYKNCSRGAIGAQCDFIKVMGSAYRGAILIN